MMLTRNWNRFHAQSRKILSGAVGGAVTIFSLALAGQTQPALQITSPTDGTIVAPGQTISVNVTAIGNISFKQVFVIGQQPLPVSSIANSVPAQFSIIVPQKISEGKYLLTASGITSANQDQGSSPITIDVERPDVPTRLTSDPDRVIFGSQGETE